MVNVGIILNFLIFNIFCYSLLLADGNKAFGHVVYNYVKSLLQRFPHHELEVQMEMKGPIQNFVTHKTPHLYKRTMGALFQRSSTIAISNITANVVTEQFSTMHAEPKAVAIMNQKQPVFKEDLEMALSDLEKKLSKLILRSSDSQHGNEEIVAPPVNSLRTNTELDKKINRVVEIIKKGIILQENMPPKDDEELEWMQIKIPKNL